MKKCILLLLALAVLLTGCSSASPAPTTEETTVPTETTTAPTETEPVVKSREDTKILISLPEENDPHWSSAGQDLQMMLQNLFYQVSLVYAGGDPLQQAQQLEEAIENGTDCLIVAAVDPTTLMDSMALAAEEDVLVVAYDRMLMDTEAVDYYVSYDYKAMGVALGQHIVAEKALDSLDGSLSIEFFMGSPEDNNALLLYTGIMEVLQPYLESGVLVSQTGRTAFEDTCVVDWDRKTVEESLRGYLSEYYRKGAPDILCTVSDDFAAACIAVMEEKKPNANALITGLGATEEALLNLETGKQSVTVSTDLLALDEKCTLLVDAVLTGKVPELNDTENCHNNVKVVPAWLCDFSLQTPEPPQEETEPTETQ